MILSSRCAVDLREDGTSGPSLRPEGKLGTIVHFLVNVGGGVWSGTKTLAAFHRPRWRVMLVAVYQGQLRPDFAELHCILGEALLRQRKFDEAKTHFQEALRIKPDFEDARKGLQIIERGMPGAYPPRGR